MLKGGVTRPKMRVTRENSGLMSVTSDKGQKVEIDL